MMATVLRKVKLGNNNKSEAVSPNGAWETKDKDDRRRVNPSGETFVQCGRVCGLVNVCTGPADSMGSRRRRNRPRGRGTPHLTLFQSLQLRIDLWTSTTGHLLDRSFTRRFCHRKSENELYRSNSFRFEKFDKQDEDLAHQGHSCKMMPVKEILEMRHLTPRPPVLVIDESTIKATSDAGPICGCDEKYDFIKNYKPFIVGGVNPYNRRHIPDTDSFYLYWKRLKIGERDLIFEKPFAKNYSELPENFSPPKEPPETELMFLRQPKYSEGYLKQKLKQCPREHSEGCSCRDK